MNQQNLWQQLVQQTYARQEGDLRDTDPDEFYQRIDPLQRKAVLLWDFDYQVLEGGFSHWIMNARSGWIEEVRDLVKEVGTENANLVLSILDQVLPLAGSESEADTDRLFELTNRYVLGDPIGYESPGGIFIKESLRDRFANDVETWLLRQGQAQS